MIIYINNKSTKLLHCILKYLFKKEKWFLFFCHSVHGLISNYHISAHYKLIYVTDMH